jgi:hypothetical protein
VVRPLGLVDDEVDGPGHVGVRWLAGGERSQERHAARDRGIGGRVGREKVGSGGGEVRNPEHGESR